MNRKLPTACLLCGVLIAAAASAAETDNPPNDNPPNADTQYVDFNGVKVGIDPRTGKLRPLTASEQRELAAAMRRDRGKHRDPFNQPDTEAQARSTFKRSATGAMSMQVPDSLLSSMTVQRDAQGRLVFSEQRGPAPAATKPEGLPHE